MTAIDTIAPVGHPMRPVVLEVLAENPDWALVLDEGQQTTPMTDGERDQLWAEAAVWACR